MPYFIVCASYMRFAVSSLTARPFLYMYKTVHRSNKEDTHDCRHNAEHIGCVKCDSNRILWLPDKCLRSKEPISFCVDVSTIRFNGQLMDPYAVRSSVRSAQTCKYSDEQASVCIKIPVMHTNRIG